MSQMPPPPPGGYPPQPPGPPGGYPPGPGGPPPGYPPQPPGPPGGGWGQQSPPPGPPGGQWGQPAPKGTNPLIFVAIGVIVLIIVGAGAFVLLSGDDDQRDEYVEALTDGYLASAETETETILSDLSEEELNCTAEVMVDAIGVDRLAEDYTPDELRTEASDPEFELLEDEPPTQEEAEEVVDGMDQCWGFFDKLREEVRTDYESDPSITEEIISCTMDALDDDFLRATMVDDFTEAPGTDTRTATSERIQTECGHLAPGA